MPGMRNSCSNNATPHGSGKERGRLQETVEGLETGVSTEYGVTSRDQGRKEGREQGTWSKYSTICEAEADDDALMRKRTRMRMKV